MSDTLCLLGVGGLRLAAFDDFVDIDGTDLTAHIMEKGAGWSAEEGSYAIEADAAQCQSVSGAGLAAAVVDCGAADVTLTDTISVNANVAGRWGLALRRSYNGTTESGWRITVNIASQLLEIIEIVDDVQTIRATAAIVLAANTVYSLWGKAHGLTIAARFNDGARLFYNAAATNQSVTTHGIDDDVALIASHHTWRAAS